MAAIPWVFVAGIVHAHSLEIEVVDETGAMQPCRVLVRSASRCYLPDNAVVLETGPDQWFMSPGHSALDVPEDTVLVRVERGHEFVRVRERVHLAGERTSHVVRLHRWIDMRRRGYLCGENHLHVDTTRLAAMLVAEALDFGTSLTWWRGPDRDRPVPPGDGPERLLEFAGRRVPATVHDAELEYDWGAAYIQQLPAPMPLEARPGRPNLDYLRHAVGAGAIVHYQGGWSREVLLDALLGCVHTVNVCNNNFALHRFQPRSRYSNLLEVDGFPIYPDTDVGMMRMNTETYYRLLNCGLRLAAGAGSATGVKQAPPGYNRAYVRVPEHASLRNYYEAWKAGRNFVTNGPMLMLTTASGKRPGATIDLKDGGSPIALGVEAIAADLQLTSVQIVVNGQVAADVNVENPHRVEGEHLLEISQPSWIVARCTARDDLLSDEELAAYDDPRETSAPRFRPSRLRFAHTSPIYVTLDGRRVREESSINEGLSMLDAFAAFASKHADPEYRPSIDSAVDEARKMLTARLDLDR